MKLPRIYEYFVPGQLVSISEMKEKLDRSGNTLRKRLSELAARGYLVQVRQGLYIICSAGSRWDTTGITPFSIASNLTANSIVGYRTALQYHTGVMPGRNQGICVISQTKFNGFEFHGYNYLWCQSSEFHESHNLLPSPVSPNTIRVTSVEQSVFDCLKRPLHCPNFDQLVFLCEQLKGEVDVDKLTHIAVQSNTSSLNNRLGLLFEYLSEAWSVPNSAKLSVTRHMSKKVLDWNIPTHSEAPTSLGAQNQDDEGSRPTDAKKCPT